MFAIALRFRRNALGRRVKGGAMVQTESGQRRIALLVDGENISPEHAGFLNARSVALGRLTICRVYANVAEQSVWDARPGFRVIHTGKGKNLTDIVMIIEAMEIALCGQADEVIIASSDSDFIPLLRHLKERGFPTLLICEAKAQEALRKAAGRLVEIPTAEAKQPTSSPEIRNGAVVKDELLECLCKLVADAGSDGLLVSAINAPVWDKLKEKISQRPEKKWMAYLKAHPEVFDCDPRGKDARVRLKPS
jgi:uncharacterized protein (TIGR00288 family)